MVKLFKTKTFSVKIIFQQINDINLAGIFNVEQRFSMRRYPIMKRRLATIEIVSIFVKACVLSIPFTCYDICNLPRDFFTLLSKVDTTGMSV